MPLLTEGHDFNFFLRIPFGPITLFEHALLFAPIEWVIPEYNSRLKQYYDRLAVGLPPECKQSLYFPLKKEQNFTIEHVILKAQSVTELMPNIVICCE